MGHPGGDVTITTATAETCGAVGAIDLGGRGMPRPYDIFLKRYPPQGCLDRGLSQRFSAPWMYFHRRSDLNPPGRPIVDQTMMWGGRRGGVCGQKGRETTRVAPKGHR